MEPRDLPRSGAVVQLADASYRDAFGHVWVRNANLTVHQGEIMFLVGPNGQGKSLTLSVLSGDTALVTGEVRRFVTTTFISGSAMEPESTVAKDYLQALVPDQPNIDQPNINHLLKRCQIDGHRPISSLSSGQVQLLRISGALCVGRGLLLFDEPSAYLDSLGTDLLETITRELAGYGAGVVIATTDPELLVRIPEAAILTVSGGVVRRLDRSA